ncbi:MAG: CRISPR-associated protein Cas4 [Candidatus Altiarchaeota archaeon]|nr:CRISPR-associated protein Cas4 [Candidatus Altiarchaeota archaeon]
MMKIHVSSINQYMFCPRSVYLSGVLQLEPQPSVERVKGLLGHAIRKELSLRQSRILGKIHDVDALNETLLNELENVLEDVPYIYKDLLEGFEVKGFISELRPELLDEIEILKSRLEIMIDETGLEDSLERITPWRVEYPVKSDKLKFSGRIDKVMREENYFPVEIKTGNPGNGVWMGDRLQTCAYSMLLEENLGLEKIIPFGFVEYTRVQEKRPVLNTEQLRRRVLAVRDEVIEILDGKDPGVCPHGSEKKCKVCGFKEKCYEV